MMMFPYEPPMTTHGEQAQRFSNRAIASIEAGQHLPLKFVVRPAPGDLSGYVLYLPISGRYLA